MNERKSSVIIMRLVSYAATILQLVVAPSLLLAATVDRNIFRTTKRDQPVIVLGHVGHDQRCAGASPPKLFLATAPDHGRVCVKPEQLRATQDLHAGSENRCLGKRFPGLLVFYEPSEGFEGADAFKYHVEGSRLTKGGNHQTRYLVRIDVKAGASRGLRNYYVQRQQSGPIPDCVPLVS